MISLFPSPGATPTSPISNCNTHQRIALIIVLCLSASFAFVSSFVKRFVYDSDNVHVLHPAPSLFSVAHHFTDPVTRIKFPCMTNEKRYCWPLVNDIGELSYDDKGARLRVLVFKPGVEIHVRRKMWLRRVWKSWFNPVSQTFSLVSLHWLNFSQDQISEAPQLTIFPSSKQLPPLTNITRPEEKIATYDIDMVATAPTLEPRWRQTFVGTFGSKAYLDLSPPVWAHALVSVLAFFTLALFSTQASDTTPRKDCHVRDTLLKNPIRSPVAFTPPFRTTFLPQSKQGCSFHSV